MKPKPNKGKTSSDPLSYVATAPNEPVASMWAEVLENQGIRSLVRSRDPLMAAMYVPSNSPCEIYVLASQAETAKGYSPLSLSRNDSLIVLRNIRRPG